MPILIYLGTSLAVLAILLFGFDMQQFFSQGEIVWMSILIPLFVGILVVGFVEPAQNYHKNSTF